MSKMSITEMSVAVDEQLNGVGIINGQPVRIPEGFHEKLRTITLHLKEGRHSEEIYFMLFQNAADGSPFGVALNGVKDAVDFLNVVEQHRSNVMMTANWKFLGEPDEYPWMATWIFNTTPIEGAA